MPDSHIHSYVNTLLIPGPTGKTKLEKQFQVSLLASVPLSCHYRTECLCSSSFDETRPTWRNSECCWNNGFVFESPLFLTIGYGATRSISKRRLILVARGKVVRSHGLTLINADVTQERRMQNYRMNRQDSEYKLEKYSFCFQKNQTTSAQEQWLRRFLLLLETTCVSLETLGLEQVTYPQ